MSGIQAKQKSAKPGPDWVTIALFGLALVGVAAILYVIVAAISKPKDATGLSQLARGEMAKLELPAPGAGAPPPDQPLLDPQGKSVTLGQLKSGGVTIVNLWATWCAPCRMEMPSLAKLQAAYPGRLQVIAVAMEKPEARETARTFIAQYPPLAFYQDPKLAMTFALSPPAEGLPTTVIYDRTGHERARLTGGADWNSPQARAVVEALLAGR
jgi:thiol-disulfide isomerase/thioredoxin